MAFTEDLAPFFADFGVSAIYTPVGGVAATITVIFNKDYSLPQGVGEVGIPTSAPVATCKTADVSTASRGATLVIDGVTYNVIEVAPDGTGITHLRLSED